LGDLPLGWRVHQTFELMDHGLTNPPRSPDLAFDLQPTLLGRLVTLRPLRATDHDALYAVASDPLIWEQHPDQTRHQPAGFRVFFDEALASGGALLASDAGTKEPIGSSRFHGYDPRQDEVEIGWTFLARAYWGGRYNAEMKELMLRHAFQFVGRVVFLIGPGNIRSQRAVEKIGAVRAGSRKNRDGRENYLFEITPAGFAGRAGGR
jgi:RimJ/RimL family protein N-acetyltransferase